MTTRALKPALFVACLVPLGVLVADLLAGRLGAEPIREATFRTGEWGLRFLTVTLAVTPLRRAFGWNFLGAYRRMFGLFAFSYIAIHFLIWIGVDQFFAFKYIWKDIVKRPYITLGFTGLLMMTPLAVTSTAAWVRRLGKRWAQLHRLVYLVALAGIVHFTWAQKADVQRPSVYAVILVVLLATRLVPKGALERIWSRVPGWADPGAAPRGSRGTGPGPAVLAPGPSPRRTSRDRSSLARLDHSPRTPTPTKCCSAPRSSPASTAFRDTEEPICFAATSEPKSSS